MDELPLIFNNKSDSYVMRAESNVHNGVFKIGKKSGRLTAEAAQPESLRLPHPARRSSTSITETTMVRFQFDPDAANEQPPRLASLTSKLQVYTFFGSTYFRTLPEIDSCDNRSSLHGVYTQTIDLSSCNIGTVGWTRHYPRKLRKKTVLDRRDNICLDAVLLINTSSSSSSLSPSTGPVPAPSDNYDSSLPFYTTEVLVPITLPMSTNIEDQIRPASRISNSKALATMRPRKAVFLPTFHTCTISRIYPLEMNLSFHPVTFTGVIWQKLAAASMRIRTPIQILQEGSDKMQRDQSYDPQIADFEHPEGLAGDEALAYQMDRELNFTTTSTPTARELWEENVPEYEDICASVPSGTGARNIGVVVPFSSSQQSTALLPQSREQPPHYSPTFQDTR